jgi:hypothetical protein
MNDYKHFSDKLQNASRLQMQIYKMKNELSADFNRRNTELEKLISTINNEFNNIDRYESQLRIRADITLDSLGDIFNE